MVCVYCSARPATTSDHIFARTFFLERTRGNLPQAPSCERCNNRKAQLELYLTAVLPFGGVHADAYENLVKLVPRRLANNLRLARELYGGRRPIWVQDPAALYLAMTVPVEPMQTVALFAMVARALAWFHWKTYLGAEHDADSLMLTPFGQQFFDRIFAMNSRERVRCDLGNGAVSYQGVQADGNPTLTLWRFTFYGGMLFSGDPAAPHEAAREIGALTGSRRTVGMLCQRAAGLP
jgi:hypothetical protein